MYPQYMCILLYVKVIWCNGILRDLLSIGVEGGYMYPQCMCILLYVKLIWCKGILDIPWSFAVREVNVSSVYVHSVYM